MTLAQEISVSGPVVPLPGQDHATLALLPFGTPQDRFETRQIAYEALVDGRKRRLHVSLIPGAAGLPLPGDQLIFLALLQKLSGEGSAREKMCFRTRDLMAELGLVVGGSGYARLRESLDRLVQVTIKTEDTWVARDGSPYKRTTQAQGLLDSYYISSHRDEASWVEWGLLVREAFELGDLKRLDWQLARSLNHPAAVQLYRFLDRVVLSGETRYEIDWVTLSTGIGMSSNYASGANFKQKIAPYLEELLSSGFLLGWEYRRGGHFVFLLPNYLRSNLRRLLLAQGVFGEAARQLVAGYAETRIMAQLDCLPYRKVTSPGGFVTKAIRDNYPLQYPPEERAAFLQMMDLLLRTEVEAYHRAALRLLGANLFDAQPDPTSWTVECRAAVRFLVTNNLDPDLV